MAPVLRRKLICFYCNCHSAQDRRRGLQQWQCENCDAVNHLDQVRSSARSKRGHLYLVANFE